LLSPATWQSLNRLSHDRLFNETMLYLKINRSSKGHM
jgi:hypothetical protein